MGGEVDKKFEPALNFTGENDAETNAQQLAVAQEAETAFTNLQKGVLATFPTLFDQEGKRVPEYGEEYAKLIETPTYKGKEKDLVMVDTILPKYEDLLYAMSILPKDIEAIASRKQGIAARAALERELRATSVELTNKLREDDALVKDKALEQDVAEFIRKVDAVYPRGQGMNPQFRQVCETIVQRTNQLKQGGGQPGPTNLTPVNWATWKSCSKHKNKKADCQQAKCTEWSTKTNGSSNKAKKGTCSKKGPGLKPHTKAECKGKGHDSKAWKATTAEKKGMAWYWWVVIIGGILAVLGTVAYLFLGSDASNDEEWSPEEEA